VLFPLIAAGWLAIGVVAAAVMHRRGHDTFAWGVLFLFLGPLALPLAISSDRHPPPQPDAPTRGGRLDLLVAHDGSREATAALQAAMDLVGPYVTSVTVTCVLDLEAASTVRGRDTQRETQARLDAVAHRLAAATSAPVDTTILFGEPTQALQRFAAEHGYELIVAAAWRRVTHKRTAASAVPVLIGPGAP
jgi:hypothetical protein